MQLGYILLCSLGSVFLGYFLRLPVIRLGKEASLAPLSAAMKTLALGALIPFATVNSFWTFPLNTGRYAFLPFIGAGSLMLGGAAALFYIKRFKPDPKQAGSIFTSCMFSNISALATFVAYTLLGEEGFACLQVFALFEQPLYFIVGFPLSNEIAKGALSNFRLRARMITEKPITLFPIGALIVGLALHASGLEKPEIFSSVVRFLVPIITILFGLSLGLTLRITKVGKYRKEIIFVHLVKFVLVPVFVLSTGFLAGLADTAGGLPFKVLLIGGSIPVAFMAVVAPTIYGFDVDLANSAWLTTTLSHIGILAVLVAVI